MNVALFIPCYVDQCYPQVGMATAELLERQGASVTFPEQQTCCGQPMANSGSVAETRPVARKMVELFAEADYVVCPSGSCTSMVRNHYADLLPGEAGVAALANKTYELCEFLHDVMKVSPQGRYPARVGLHQSCHGLRELRLGSGSERLVPPFNKVRDVLSNVEGLQLVDLQRPDECCGFGGMFSTAEEAVSCAMGRDRLADHQQGGAQVITSVDMSCLMHLDGLIRREQRPLKVMHVAELLLEATR